MRHDTVEGGRDGECGRIVTTERWVAAGREWLLNGEGRHVHVCLAGNSSAMGRSRAETETDSES